jgi:hypothetical protein
MISAYAAATSVTQGTELMVYTSSAARARIVDVSMGIEVWHGMIPGEQWTLRPEWSSSLYRIELGDGCDVYFVVRAERPGAVSKVLVSIPFITWQAYNNSRVPGAGLYLAEDPDRAVRVSFDRPGGGPAGHWEEPFLRWFAEQGYRFEFCSNIDLHRDADLLSHYQLLISVGHDEYWTAEMRDAVESFVEAGGNAAFFGGNTCWWQVRLEDDARTLVCYRDAWADPMSRRDPRRVTVEWSSAPVLRPENSMTGVSYRRGAGCWENMQAMAAASYTLHFADHWAFADSGLKHGDKFARGAIGYETDAADFEMYDGIPWATGRDGTPSEFTILATADLRAWAPFGKAGYATMGTFAAGAGTVFNVATVGWAQALGDPTVSRITRNVVDRLSCALPSDRWEPIGRADGVTGLAAHEGRLYGVSESELVQRPITSQNLGWRSVGPLIDIVALTIPRESIDNCPSGLYLITTDGELGYADDVASPDWRRIGQAPAGVCAVAAAHGGLFGVTCTGQLWFASYSALSLARRNCWHEVGQAPNMCALTNLNGRLYACNRSGRLYTRSLALREVAWEPMGQAPRCVALAGYGGRLFMVTESGDLRWRSANPAPAAL